MSTKARHSRLQFCRRQYRSSFSEFDAVDSESYRFAWKNV